LVGILGMVRYQLTLVGILGETMVRYQLTLVGILGETMVRYQLYNSSILPITGLHVG
jgi:hypothetical protein